jgi:putative hydrolase of the HAD superfamily
LFLAVFWIFVLFFEEGKIKPKDFFSEVKKMLSLKLDYDGFVPIWNEIFFLTDKNRAVYNLAKKLKGRFRLALLSNINILHFDYLKKNFPIFDVFNCVLTSFELGVRKPHPLIYQKTLEELNIALPQKVFYTDDRPELIDNARRLGLRCSVFKDIAQLKRDLEASGINAN